MVGRAWTVRQRLAAIAALMCLLAAGVVVATWLDLREASPGSIRHVAPAVA